MVATGKGASLATEARGRPDKGTILMVMGATASMLWWPETLVEALADGGYQVVRFDHRDTGQSTTYPPGETRYDLDDLSGDILRILDAHGVEAAHLVGMSLGAYLGQIVALRHPERVLSLTLIAAEPLNVTYEGEGISSEFMAHFGAMAELDWSDRAAVSDFLLRSAELSSGPALPFDAEAVKKRIAAELGRTDSMQSAFNHAGVTGDVAGLDLARLSQKVLVVHGSKDPVISINAAHRTVATVPQATLMILEGRGHELAEPDMPGIAQAILQHAGS
jgi:pimeloyl-ACP methyl ester carboxylesterase